MTASIERKKCFHHPGREAVARCPECVRFYCRECVTEHEGRVLCATCIAAVSEKRERRPSPFGAVARMLQVFLSILLLWGLFYMLGEGLLTLPSSFHEGTLWQTDVWEGR